MDRKNTAHSPTPAATSDTSQSATPSSTSPPSVRAVARAIRARENFVPFVLWACLAVPYFVAFGYTEYKHIREHGWPVTIGPPGEDYYVALNKKLIPEPECTK